MRVLLTTRGSSGHLLPLAPFGHACRRAGHGVLVAAQRQHAANVERTGLAFAPHVAAIVCHGGYGSTLGALRHGVPLVVLPLFSADQWANAAVVQRAGAGIAVDPDRATRRTLGLPGDEVVAGLAPALQRLLSDPAYARAAAAIAAASAALPPVDAAVEVLRRYAT